MFSPPGISRGPNIHHRNQTKMSTAGSYCRRFNLARFMPERTKAAIAEGWHTRLEMHKYFLFFVPVQVAGITRTGTVRSESSPGVLGH